MYDVCIIGGGPAGLTAALYLARYHLTVCVIDAGKSRAALIPQSHNQSFFPDGISGAELLERMRRHLAKYPVGFEDSLVDNVEMVAEGFRVRTRRVMFLAGAVLMATGVENHRPAMSDEHHAVALRDGLLRYCPICDGYEITDRTVAVVGAGNHSFGEAKFLRSYTSKITVFAEGSPIGLTSDQRAELMSMDVRIIDTFASAYRLRDTAIEVLLGSRWQAFDTIYAALGSTIRSGIVRRLAPDMTEEGCLIVDAHQRTSVRGLYAAGDVVVGVDQIAHALGQATVAATAIRNDLSEKHALIRRAPGGPGEPGGHGSVGVLKENDAMTDKKTIERDARGQFAESQADRESDGVANAIPTKVVHEDDATIYKSDEKPSPNPGFDIRTQTNKRD